MNIVQITELREPERVEILTEANCECGSEYLCKEFEYCPHCGSLIEWDVESKTDSEMAGSING